jgi:hypothetical protein
VGTCKFAWRRQGANQDEFGGEEEEEEEEFSTSGNWRGKHNSLSRRRRRGI